MTGKIVVGGGTGFIGSFLCKSLRLQGYEVVAVSRKPGPWRITWEELRRTGLPPNTKGVVSMAGQNLLDPTRRWTPGFKQNVWASRVSTTQYLADAIKAAEQKPEVFVTMSGVGFYPTGSEEVFTEESEVIPADFLSRLCVDWEEAGRSHGTDTRTVHVRCGVVLGRNGGMVQQLFAPFYLGVGGPVGHGNQPMPWIHVVDAVGLFEHSLATPSVQGVVNGVAPHIITNREFSKAFGAALRRPALIPLPTPVVNLLFGGERAKVMTEGQRVAPAKALATGYQFKYPDIASACKEFAHLFPKKS